MPDVKEHWKVKGGSHSTFVIGNKGSDVDINGRDRIKDDGRAAQLPNPFVEGDAGEDISRNPYKFNSGSTVAPDGYSIGRKAELDCLIGFCEKTPFYINEAGDFAWFAISGKGGTGKTRLAHDLIKN